MKKVLIIGPFDDYGGREIDTAFIASSLRQEFEITICSLGNITSSCQIKTYLPNINLTSVKERLYKNYIFLKPAAILSYFKNGRKEPVYFYINNAINYRIGLRKKELQQLRVLVKQCDLIFIRAHIHSLKTKEIIDLGFKHHKKIIFRTTGEIGLEKSWSSYLNKVNLFIHHSQNNADNLHAILNVPYKVIDQSAIQEDFLLQTSLLNDEIRNFAVIGRLSLEKNIPKLVSFFKDVASISDKLFIIGDGDERSIVKKNVGSCTNIKVLGHLSTLEIADFFKKIDCLIISSSSEAGPLVGVEAMAAARLILSTKVGAMPKRLGATLNNFWFEPDNFDSFKKEYKSIKGLSLESIKKISKSNRDCYLQNNSRDKISELYLSTIKEVFSGQD